MTVFVEALFIFVCFTGVMPEPKYFKGLTRTLMIPILFIVGLLGVIVSIVSFVDLFNNSCSNKQLSEALGGMKTPLVHFGVAGLEMAIGVSLIMSSLALVGV